MCIIMCLLADNMGGGHVLGSKSWEGRAWDLDAMNGSCCEWGHVEHRLQWGREGECSWGGWCLSSSDKVGTYHKRELGSQGKDEVGTPSVDVLVPFGRIAQETVLGRGPTGCFDLVVGGTSSF